MTKQVVCDLICHLFAFAGFDLPVDLLGDIALCFYPFKDGFALKVTHWYRMKYTGAGTTKPQTEEDITEVKWVSESEINEVLENTYENIKLVLES